MSGAGVDEAARVDAFAVAWPVAHQAAVKPPPGSGATGSKGLYARDGVIERDLATERGAGGVEAPRVDGHVGPDDGEAATGVGDNARRGRQQKPRGNAATGISSPSPAPVAS